MDTFLDLLIVVVLAMAATALFAILGMFLIKNRVIRRVCFYVVATLGVYLGYVGVRIMGIDFPGQSLLALMMASASIGAIVLSFVRMDNKKLFLTARIMASAALVVGMLNAFCI